MTIEDELLKKLIGEYVKKQQAAQTKHRIFGRQPDVLGHLEQRLLSREITSTEYKKRKTRYVESLYELYVEDIITYEELREKLNR